MISAVHIKTNDVSLQFINLNESSAFREDVDSLYIERSGFKPLCSSAHVYVRARVCVLYKF